jgi:hypothetical protein
VRCRIIPLDFFTFFLLVNADPMAPLTASDFLFILFWQCMHTDSVSCVAGRIFNL